MRVATRAAGRWRHFAAMTLVFCFCVIARSTVLFAHAELLRTEPAADAVLLSAPAQLRLWFSEPVDTPADGVTVLAPDGTRADRRDSRIVPGEEGALAVSLVASAQGTYVVRWRAISADSHPISGEFRFSIGQTSEPVATEVISPSDSTMDVTPLQASARWLHLMGLSLVVGPLVLVAVTRALRDDVAIHRSLWRGSAWGSLLIFLAALVALVAQSSAVAGSLREGLQSDALLGLLGTRWGALWTARISTIIVVALLTHLAAHRQLRPGAERWWLATVLFASALLVASTALNSHSAATAPVWLSLMIDWIHVAATVVWIGGLFALVAMFLPATRRLDTNGRLAAMVLVVPRFSVLALVAVELLVVTGLYHAWAHVSDPSALVSTAYGRTLLIKLLLIAAMLMPAAFNLLVIRRRLVPSRLLTASDERRFARSVGVEAVLGTAVLATVGVLTSLPPAQTLQAAVPTARAAAPAASAPTSEPAVTLSAAAGRYLVTLALAPGRIGSNHLDVRVQDDRGAAVTDLPVKLRIIPPAESRIGSWVVAPTAQGEHRQATVALAPGGRWQVDVELQEGSEPFPAASFLLSLPVRGAAELLAVAVERMNGLQSVEEDVEMLMAGVRSTSHTVHIAPLGLTWLDSATDATVLRRDTIDGQECIVVAYVDSRDGSRVQVWISTTTWLVVQRVAAAPGHVHTSRYSHFGAVARSR